MAGGGGPALRRLGVTVWYDNLAILVPVFVHLFPWEAVGDGDEVRLSQGGVAGVATVAPGPFALDVEQRRGEGLGSVPCPIMDFKQKLDLGLVLGFVVLGDQFGGGVHKLLQHPPGFPSFLFQGKPLLQRDFHGRFSGWLWLFCP